MTKHNFTLLIFLVMCAVQWIVPVRTILSSNSILSKGMLYKFLTAPVDPNDPFRGKYVALNYQNNTVIETKGLKINSRDKLFISLGTDDQGYARIDDYNLFSPNMGENILEVTIERIEETNGQKTLIVEFPFNRFYVEESKAKTAEENYRSASRDPQSKTWAEVYVKEGKAVLQDVKTDGVSIVDF